jgi:acyl-coenzyme A thioesterase PaaI-like protein
VLPACPVAEEGPSCPPPVASSRRAPAGAPNYDRQHRRDAVGSLGAALRELVDAAVRTEVSVDELAAVEEVVRAAAARLRADQRALTQIAAVDDPEVGERWYNPVYGPGSPLAPPLVVTESAHGRVRGEVTLGKPYEGPPGLVHGGFTATLLDHALARSARSAGHGGLTATLSVRYRRPVPLGTALVVRAELGTTEGRRATATATLTTAADPDTVLAEGEAVLIALRPERAAEVFAPTGRPVSAWTVKGPPPPHPSQARSGTREGAGDVLD